MRLSAGAEVTDHHEEMLLALLVVLLVLIVGTRPAVRVVDRRWPHYSDAVSITMIVGKHALLAFAFAWIAYRLAAGDPLHLAASVLFVVFGMWEVALAVAVLYVLAKPSAS